MIRVTSNMAAVKRGLADLARKQMPFAVATGLTATARDIETNVAKRIVKAFDRPTQFTRRALFVRVATKSNLRAVVGIKDKQAEYLKIQETGGTRLPKGRALLFPGAAKLNQYGNIPRGAVQRALARPDTFSGKVHGIAGIWKRGKKGQPPQLQFAYEDRAEYQPVFRFRETADKTAEARLRINITRGMAQAISTARP